MKNTEWMDWQEKCLEFKDERPLAEKILRKLGFKYTPGGVFYIITDMIKLEAIELEPQKKVVVVIDGNYNDKTVPHWKTVGSVKMLIEALEGD